MSRMIKYFLLAAAALMLFGFCGCAELWGGDEPTASEAAAVEYKGAEKVLEIPVGEGEGRIPDIFTAEGELGLADLRAVSDDEFIVLDSANMALYYLGRDGMKKTVSLEGVCSAPMRVAYKDGVTAVLDAGGIALLDENGQVTDTLGLPEELDRYYHGVTYFEFDEGGLTWQVGAEKSFRMEGDKALELGAVVSVGILIDHAQVTAHGGTWKVPLEKPPVYPVAVRGIRLLAVTYGSESETPAAGLYIARTDAYALAELDVSGCAAGPLPFDFTMSPSGRVYALTCYEDRVELSELVFETVG